MEVGGASI